MTWWGTTPRRPLTPDSLERQQQLLAVGAAAVAAEPAAAVEHAVTGHHDRDRIRAERVAGRTGAARASRGGGHALISRDAAVGNPGGVPQHPPAKAVAQ